MKSFAVALFSILVCLGSPYQGYGEANLNLFRKPSWHHYLAGSKAQQEELKQLFTTLSEEESPENRFILIQEIIKVLNSTSRKELLNLFLTTNVERNPGDPFNAYYLLIVAQQYKQNGAFPFAVHYYERILRNYSDLLVRGRSVHYLCLTSLIEIGGSADIMVSYYKELLGRFEKEIDKGPIYYYMAKAYEDLGEWDLAMQAYRQFLQYPDARVPGAPDAIERVRPIVEFYDYKNKDWTTETLEELVAQLTYAVRNRNSRLLTRYRTKVNFFAVSWEQDKTIADAEFLADLGSFMNQRISYAAKLEGDSNNREAYLRTTGWSYRIPTWYLYFRRIHFPADPDIHGRWEWAGIYLGEKPFTSSLRPESNGLL
jgi:tetratricopeptide (TPR) repeat protein